MLKDKLNVFMVLYIDSKSLETLTYITLNSNFVISKIE